MGDVCALLLRSRSLGRLDGARRVDRKDKLKSCANTVRAQGSYEEILLELGSEPWFHIAGTDQDVEGSDDIECPCPEPTVRPST